jgi:hypothetical protein
MQHESVAGIVVQRMLAKPRTKLLHTIELAAVEAPPSQAMLRDMNALPALVANQVIINAHITPTSAYRASVTGSLSTRR